MQVCAKTIMKESHNFELACLKEKNKKKKKEKHFGCLVISGSVLSQCFFMPLQYL